MARASQQHAAAHSSVRRARPALAPLLPLAARPHPSAPSSPFPFRLRATTAREHRRGRRDPYPAAPSRNPRLCPFKPSPASPFPHPRPHSRHRAPATPAPQLRRSRAPRRYVLTPPPHHSLPRVAQKIRRAAEESPKPNLPELRSRSAGFPPGGPPPVNTSATSIPRRRCASVLPDPRNASTGTL